MKRKNVYLCRKRKHAKMKNWKPILDSILCMAKCSLWTTFMNLSIIVVIFIPFIALYNLLCYIILGTPIHYLLRKQEWMFQTIMVWLIVNTVSIIIMWHLLMPSGGEGPMCISPFSIILPATSALASFLSIIPIGFMCRKARQKTEE